MGRLVTVLLIKVLQAFWTSVVACGLLIRWIMIGSAISAKKEHQLPERLKKYNHKYIQLSSGIRMHYVEEGDEKAPLMVLIHGFPEFWYSWRFQIEHFKKNYRVVAIDQRGYGDSDKPDEVTAYAIDLLARDVDLLIHALGYDKAVVVGHDWGGAVAWTYAMRYPETVSNLIVLNLPHPDAFQKLIMTNFKQLLSSWYMFVFQTPWLPEFMIAAEDFKAFEGMFWGKSGLQLNKDNISREDMEAWKYTFGKPGALTGPLNYYRCFMQHPSEEKPKMCKPRSLLIWGDKDTALIKEGAIRTPEWCEDGRVLFVDGASHWVQQDAPDRVNDLMEEFLA